MRRRFSRTVWRATSVGCAVNTGVIAIWRSAATASSAEIPASFMRSSVPRNEPGSGGLLAIQFAGAAAALAMVGLGQIGQFEISREGLGHLVGAGQVHPGNHFLRLEHQFGRGSLLADCGARFRDARSAVAATLRPIRIPPALTARPAPVRGSRPASAHLGAADYLSRVRRNARSVRPDVRVWSSAFHSGLGLFGAINKDVRQNK